MAKPFGQADIGLIKATAGAEASQFMDTGLMTASVIGGVLDKVNARNAVIAKQNAALEKEMAGKFKLPPGTLSYQMQEYVSNTTMNDKDLYTSYTGSDITSKLGQQQVMLNHASRMDQISYAAEQFQIHLADDAQYGAGMSAQDQVYGEMMTDGDYIIEDEINEKTGQIQVMFGFEKMQEPELTTEIAGLIETEEGKNIAVGGEVVTLTDEEKLTLGAYRKLLTDYEKHSELPDTIDGKRNPAKYDFFSAKELPSKGTNIEIETKNLTTWNTYHDNKSDKDYEWNPGAHKGDVENYSRELQTSLKGTTTKDLRDMGNSDWSKDGIDNSFNSIFVDGANLEKHPNMYQNDDGTGIKVTFNDPDDPDGPEVELVYDAKTNTFKQAGELVDISESQKKQILNDYLRDLSETEPELYIKKYADFMGVVSADAFEIEQKAHFETQNKYFNTGVEGENPIYNEATDATTAKFETYINTKLEAALPMDMILNPGIKSWSEEGKVAKALAAEFPPESGVEFEFDNDTKKMNVKVGGENMDFDFSKDPDLEYKRLQNFISDGMDIEAVNRFNNEGKNLSNDARDDDWGKISDKQYKYHSYPRGKYEKSMNDYIKKYPDTNTYVVKGPNGQILDSKNVHVIEHVGNYLHTILYNGNVMKNVYIKSKPTESE